MKAKNYFRYKITLKKCEESLLAYENITSSSQCVAIARQIWDQDSLFITESSYCLFMNRANKPIGWILLSTGGTIGTVIDVKVILNVGISLLAHTVIIFHNHPSGNMEPSESDKAITREVIRACNAVTIKVLDHIIISPEVSPYTFKKDYYSFADEGIL